MTFNYLGRDFYNAISEKNVDAFQLQLIKYLAGFCVGIPVYVFKAYYQVLNSWLWFWLYGSSNLATCTQLHVNKPSLAYHSQPISLQ